MPLVADFRKQLHIGRDFGRFRQINFCIFLALHLVHGTDNDEKHESNDEEVQRDCQELAIS
jgi:hypothetical protein